jgi:UDPglucose 6-dehydrogenase
MNISVVGSGYVGLITAAGFAEKGHNVVCVDIDPRKVEMINSKIPPIYERGLKEIMEHVIPSNLKASLELEDSILGTDVTFVCVGTPSDNDGSINLKYVKKVCEQIGAVLKNKNKYHTIVVKSTIIPGSSDGHVIPALEEESGKKAGEDFGVVMNPEFLREGAAVKDFMEPDRIVIGSLDQKCGDIIESLYYEFKSPVLRVNLKTAEMIKYTSNSLLATKISFINEIGNVCKRMGIDVYDVAKGTGLDHRIGPHFLNAGPGFGGSCFPKDVKALVHKANDVGVQPTLLNAVLEVNRKQPERMLEILDDRYNFEGLNVTVLGIAFKAETDDIRESPAQPIIEGLIKRGAKITAYDPKAMENAKKEWGNKIEYAKDMGQALKDSELAIIMTEWEEFKTPDLKPMKTKQVFDSRHIINQDLLDEDVKYEGLHW